MIKNFVKLILLVCSCLVSCDKSAFTDGKEELEVYILKAYSNYGNGQKSDSHNQEQPPELYYTIIVKNKQPSYLYIHNAGSPYGNKRLISNFQASLTCNGNKVYLRLYNVTSSITYLDPYATDTINIKAYFKEIRDRAEECSYEKIASFIEEVVQEGNIIYIAQPSNGRIESGGKSYLPIDSFSIDFDERSSFEFVQ